MRTRTNASSRPRSASSPYSATYRKRGMVRAPDDDDLWIDFRRRRRRRFNANYARRTLDRGAESHMWRTNHAAMQNFILGGDEFIPMQTASNYAHRMRGPYRAALPTRPKDHPHLYAIPGNHDWYDGLTAFLRLSHRTVGGGLRTLQSRSYFALRLTHKYCLWGSTSSSRHDWTRRKSSTSAPCPSRCSLGTGSFSARQNRAG